MIEKSFEIHFVAVSHILNLHVPRNTNQVLAFISCKVDNLCGRTSMKLFSIFLKEKLFEKNSHEITQVFFVLYKLERKSRLLQIPRLVQIP